MEGRVETEFEFMTTCSDTMINYWLSQKLKLLGKSEFKHLTIILTQLIANFRFIATFLGSCYTINFIDILFMP